jgi:pimeloyl-ACP methyl ester carboxylesterase
MAAPTTQYARSGDLSIAYQVVGDGPIDLLFLPGWISQVEHSWEEPALARFFERLASFSRLILFDRRGTGLSDTLTGPPTAEDELEDALAVLDAVGSERTAIMAWAAGGATGALLTARHPERVGALVMYAAMVSTTAAADYDWTHTPEQRVGFIEEMVANWGDGSRIATFAPSMDGDPRFRTWLSRMERLSASPGTIRAIFEAAGSVDVRAALDRRCAVGDRRDRGVPHGRTARIGAPARPADRYVHRHRRRHGARRAARRSALARPACRPRCVHPRAARALRRA